MTCPVCGFDQVDEGYRSQTFSVPYGPSIETTLSNNRCSNCTEEWDSNDMNTPRIERALAESTQKSIPVMVDALIGYGYTLVYCERALRLPFGTFQKWLDKPDLVDPGSVVMLRMVATYPWLLQAADDNFRQASNG